MTNNVERIGGVVFSYPKAHGTIQQYAGYITREYNKALELRLPTMASQYLIKLNRLIEAGVITQIIKTTTNEKTAN